MVTNTTSNNNDEHDVSLINNSVKHVQRPVSIREFQKQKTLGVGNFSEIVIAQHRISKETFALKILNKKQAADLAKRQHPNVYNEIKMERRVLMERLPSSSHKNIIQMYHSFQDYENLYYLMDLHNQCPDLWNQIRYQNKMVGCHYSQIQFWLWQLVDALQHLHSHGIVHRDLKPENVLLNEYNHIVVIDFGTAKDLVQTDLNGPEFVGTPDFMSPEAVTGPSGMPKPEDDATRDDEKKKVTTFATHATDLWALGAMAFILMTGSTPFWSPSPYLTFLRIKRGRVLRMPWAIPDDDAWDFIQSLMKVKPSDRLGATSFELNKNYDDLKQHPFFNNMMHRPKTDERSIPTLQDLCIRACAELAKQDASDLEICDQHPAGDGSNHDMLRLSKRQQNLVMHVLDKCRVFSNGDETRVLHRFVDNDIDYLGMKARQESRDMVGLTQMNDDEGKVQSARGSADPYVTKDDPIPTPIVHLTHPTLLLDVSSSSGESAADHASSTQDDGEAQRKALLKEWKKCIASINRQRPKLVVVCGHLQPKYKKFLARISDSIPVALNERSAFFSFWLHGFQGMVLQSSTLQQGRDDGNNSCSEQMAWIQEQMEQCRMAKHYLFAFVDCDPRELSPLVLKRLARGRVLLLSGLSKDEPFDIKVSYQANEKVDDDVSVKSTSSAEDEADEFTMRVVGSKDTSMRWLVVDEMKDEWETRVETYDQICGNDGKA